MRHLVEDRLHATGLGVGEEHLSETVAADEGDELFDPQEVELVEDVVEEEDRLDAMMVEQILELRQFQREGETLLLTLRAETLEGHVVVEGEEEVVLVGSAGGVLRIAVGLTALGELKQQGSVVVEIGDVAGLVVAAGNPMVIFHEQGLEILDEGETTLIEVLAMQAKLVVPDGHHGLVPLAVVPHGLQEAVALFERLVVVHQVVEIGVVDLGDGGIDKLAAKFAAAGDERLVVGRHHHQGDLADMLGERLVGLLVPTHLLRLSLLQNAAGHPHPILGVGIMAVDGEEIGTAMDVLAVDRVETALAKRKVIGGIEQVGLPCPIVAEEAVDIATELDVGLDVAFEIAQYESLQYHIDGLVSLKSFTLAATSSISHRGVEVAPLMPTRWAPASMSATRSSTPPMR